MGYVCGAPVAGGMAACPVCSEHIGDVGGDRNRDSSSPTDVGGDRYAVPSEDVSSARLQSASLQIYQGSVSVLGRTCGRGLIRLTVCL